MNTDLLVILPTLPAGTRITLDSIRSRIGWTRAEQNAAIWAAVETGFIVLVSLDNPRDVTAPVAAGAVQTPSGNARHAFYRA